MKILIGIPCMDMVQARFAQCLATLNKVEDCFICFSIGSFTPQSRDEIVKQAIEMDADYVLQLDSDMVFSQNILIDLLSDHKDIVSGLYFRRNAPYTPVLYSKVAETEYEEQITYPDELFKVEGTGMACTLIKTEVFKAVKEKYGELYSCIGRLTEDLSFCLRAKGAGYDIWVDPNVKAGHIGNIIIDERLYKEINE